MALEVERDKPKFSVNMLINDSTEIFLYMEMKYINDYNQDHNQPDFFSPNRNNLTKFWATSKLANLKVANY